MRVTTHKTSCGAVGHFVGYSLQSSLANNLVAAVPAWPGLACDN